MGCKLNLESMQLFRPEVEFISGLDKGRKTHMANGLRPGSQSGAANGMSFLVDVESYEYEGRNSVANGVRVAIHHHLDVGITSLYGKDMSPGQTIQVNGGFRRNKFFEN